MEEKILEELSSRLRFFRGSYDEKASYESYQSFLQETLSIDLQNTTHIVYLSVPPQVSPDILSHVSSVFDPFYHDIRVIIEKPFGEDYDSAKALLGRLTSLYPERSLYFLDHYLGKSTVRDLHLLTES